MGEVVDQLKASQMAGVRPARLYFPGIRVSFTYHNRIPPQVCAQSQGNPRRQIIRLLYSLEKDISVQAKRVIENVKAVIEEAGGTLSNVVKVTFFLYVGDDPEVQAAHFAAFNKVYETYFTGVRPARAFVPVYNPKNVPGCSMDAVAVLPE